MCFWIRDQLCVQIKACIFYFRLSCWMQTFWQMKVWVLFCFVFRRKRVFFICKSRRTQRQKHLAQLQMENHKKALQAVFCDDTWKPRHLWRKPELFCPPPQNWIELRSVWSESWWARPLWICAIKLMLHKTCKLLRTIQRQRSFSLTTVGDNNFWKKKRNWSHWLPLILHEVTFHCRLNVTR